MNRIIAERTLQESPFDAEDARAALREMVRARRFDERALALQRRGWMSGYPPFRGQEAAQIGAAAAMASDDLLFPTYRSNALQLARGVPMSDILLYRRGLPEFASDHDVPVFTQAVPIASQIPHGTGAAMAADYRDEDYVSFVCLGDGATSQGDFHEGLNFAGVFDVPVVFFCENNSWAISLPTSRQTASESIAIKAEAYGIEGMQVDGNDPLATRETVAEALTAARTGDPVLIEALTYRQGAHTTADDPSQYQDAAPDLPDWRTRDPIERFAEWCDQQGLEDVEALRDETRETAESELETAIERAEAHPRPGPEDLFDPVYADLPRDLERQKATARQFADTADPYELDR